MRKKDEDTEKMESDSEEREGMASEEKQGHVTIPVSHQPVDWIVKKIYIYIKRPEKKSLRKQRQQENMENAALKKKIEEMVEIAFWPKPLYLGQINCILLKV